MIPEYPRPDGRDKIVIGTRVSSDKQKTLGDTLNIQVGICQSYLLREGIPVNNVIKIFPIVETAGKEIDEREYFKQLIDYCIDPQNKVAIVLFAYIDRVTRVGVEEFRRIKKTLSDHDVILQIASTPLAQDESTLDYLGHKYSWSTKNPTEAIEIKEAQEAKDERRRILTRLIGSEIKYTQDGYWARRPPYGYKNKKDTTIEGSRTILVPNEPEAKLMIKMYEMAKHGTYTDKQIVDQINALGYRSRLYNRKNENGKIIGRIGGELLDEEQFRKLIRRPIYAGIIVEKWTHYKPIKAKFDGLVDLETFNKANNGKVLIKNFAGELEVLYDQKPRVRISNNPDYPYKKYVLCPKCKKTLIGSASTGKSGRRFPAYHCARNHSRFSVKTSTFNETIKKFLHQIEFTDEKKEEIKRDVITVWNEKELDINDIALIKEKELATLRETKKQLYAELKGLGDNNTAYKRDLNTEYEEVCGKIEHMQNARNIVEKEELEINKFVKYVQFVMEHPQRILMDTDNSTDLGIAFSSFFNTLPTYEDLVNGTPDLKPIYKLKALSETENTSLVTPQGIEP